MLDTDRVGESLLCVVEETNSAPHPPCWIGHCCTSHIVGLHSFVDRITSQGPAPTIAWHARGLPSVFFSYSRNDLALIKELEAQLKAQPKVSIWRDQKKIYGGQKWPRVLGEAIVDQDVVLPAWSKRAAASYFVEFEWSHGHRAQEDDRALPHGSHHSATLPCRDRRHICR